MSQRVAQQSASSVSSSPDAPRAIGEGSRLKEPLSPLMAKHFHEWMSPRDPLLFACLSAVNRSHIVMLIEEGILEPPAGAKILDALVDLDEQGYDGLSNDFVHGELFTHMEQYVMQHAGNSIGGNLHIGRSRGDLYITTHRLYLRQQLVTLLDQLLELRAAFFEIAKHHRESVMTSYTHGQQAQFITFAHYLCGPAGSAERDTQRTLEAYERANRNSLGTGVGAGSSWPLDRDRTGELLGFGTNIIGSYDALFGQDYILEAAMCATSIAANQLPLVLDLYAWCASEFNYVDLSDAHCGSSSLMPQKKNPMGLEVVRSRLARVPAALNEVLTIHKAENIMERCIFAFQAGRDALNTVTAMLGLEREIVLAMEMNVDRMFEVARSSYAGSAELANTLVRDHGLSFREAHRVVGTLVRVAFDRGLEPFEIDDEVMQEAATESTGTTLPIDAADVRAALDPREVIRRLATPGSSNPRDVDQVLETMAAQLETDRRLVGDVHEALDSAAAMLDERVRDLRAP